MVIFMLYIFIAVVVLWFCVVTELLGCEFNPAWLSFSLLPVVTFLIEPPERSRRGRIIKLNRWYNGNVWECA